MQRARGLAKTSVDIMCERDALRAEVDSLREALSRVRRECSTANENPSLAFLTVCRIRTIADLAVTNEQDDEPVSMVRMRR